jgi:hypothetical protein
MLGKEYMVNCENFCDGKEFLGDQGDQFLKKVKTGYRDWKKESP